MLTMAVDCDANSVIVKQGWYLSSLILGLMIY